MRMKLKFSKKNKIIIIAFALYLTFILLSRVPYIAQNQMRSVTDNMESQYVYNLEFPSSGEHTHYYVILDNESSPGKITLTYTTSSHTLVVKSVNIRNLLIDCKSVYEDESMDVFKESPMVSENLYKDYFIDEREAFTINVETDTVIDELRFQDAPEPVSVLVDDEEWWKRGEGLYYSYEPGNIILTNVPEGTTQVILHFKLIQPPKALFSIAETNTETIGGDIYGFVNKEISFDGSESHDNFDGGNIVSYEWDFGNNETAYEAISSSTYTNTGKYTVKLTVTDNKGLSSNITKTISIIISSDDLDVDGLPDAWEKSYGLDTSKDDSNEDPDNDKLTNKEEHQYGTNPKAADSDGDKYNDYQEIMNDTDPNDIFDKPEPTEKDGGGEETEDGSMMALAGLGVVIVILILIFVFLLLRKRKKKPEDEVEEPGDGAEETEKESDDEEVDEGKGEGEGKYEDDVEGFEDETETPSGDDDGLPPTKLEEEPIESGLPVRGPPGTELDSGEEDMLPPPDLSQEGETEAMDDDILPPPTPEPDDELPPPSTDSDMTIDIDTAGLGLDVEGDGDGDKVSGEPHATPGEPTESGDIPSEAEVPEDEVPEPVPKDVGEMTVNDYVKQGALYFKDGKYSEAIIEWQKALDIEPDHPEIVESIKEAMTKMQE